ncbi:GNAT family N-acetyltransferase [Maritalea porphyrae]|uniref:N-acetyltransferase domain-containing protein n=1 Tax=Maritalea porphyrae TaxID=880732 RepID=A0ABQ5UR55_9HYPH|nr:GNAT family N-acetyltransferase [Maritalea porphyrae]GLQ17748.1 hypothetical protein GCM10007879_19970 [Maritalea porphyrae]
MLVPFQPKDFESTLQFLGRCWLDEKSRNFHPGDFAHWMSSKYRGNDLDKHFALLRRSDEIIAVVEFNFKSRSYASVVAPEILRINGGEDIHRSAIKHLSSPNLVDVDKPITTNLSANDEQGINCLKDLGFSIEEDDFAVLSQPLGDTPSPELPEGFSLRLAAEDSDAAKLAAVHNGAFGPKWSAAEYLKVMHAQAFQPASELVVVSPDGDFASFVVIWCDPTSKSGLFEPVGCHKNYQRKGLTRALVYEGLARMKSAGMTSAFVGHESSNESATSFYKSLGFVPSFKTVLCTS